ESISGPARDMLEQISVAIPGIAGALVLLWVGYLFGKIVKGAAEQILPSMGFDRFVSALGISTEGATPSRTVGTIMMIAILLFFAIKSAELLNSPIIASAAVACALAFGLGGRLTAHQLLERWTQANVPPKAPARPARPNPPEPDSPPLI